MGYGYLINTVAIVLLPLVPAVLLFKVFPASSKAGAAGPFAGMEWKLGGAFAGYILVVLIVLLSFKLQLGDREEVWTIKGQIASEGLATINPNQLLIRTQPQPIDVASDGTFEISVVATVRNGDVKLPSVVFDLSSLCRGARTVSFNRSGGRVSPQTDTFGNTARQLKMEWSERTVQIEPFRLERIQGVGGPAGPCA